MAHVNRCTCGHKESRHSKGGKTRPCWHIESKCRCKNFEKADSNRSASAPNEVR